MGDGKFAKMDVVGEDVAILVTLEILRDKQSAQPNNDYPSQELRGSSLLGPAVCTPFPLFLSEVKKKRTVNTLSLMLI